MNLPAIDSSGTLFIQENTCCKINNFLIEIKLYLGEFADVNYFQAIIHNSEHEKLGLLRLGSPDGALSRELKLREALENHKMVSELLACVTQDSVYVASHSPVLENQQELNSDITEVIFSDTEEESEYLEEICYEQKDINYESLKEKLILLSYFPDEETTLATWLKKESHLESSLLLASQICQFFRYLFQREWCFIQIFPKFIQMKTPVQFFDLTGAYPAGFELKSGFLADYCAPEIAYNGSCLITEQMSTYTVSSLLYEAIHHKLLPQNNSGALDIKPIPLIYQILKICLSPIAEDRFPLNQLLSLLVQTRQSIRTPKIKWEIASHSTVGLSTSRLQNEDNYGVRQQCLSNSGSLVLGVIADGMGGMTQGEVASRITVQTIINAPIITDLNNQDKRAEWLADLVQQTNESVACNVQEGGTTLSLIMAVGRELMIAHVGDSRILLLRKGIICQLTEDHSMVAMLIASSQITYEDSLEHPDRNILTKSLGSKRRLSEGYVQDLRRFGEGLFMLLEEEDILILCSDGVWDLVSADELAQIFTNYQNLQLAVDFIINQVISKGAHDNATILAFKCYF